MMERSRNSYLLLLQFREFYAELARLRRRVDTDASSLEPAPAAAPLSVSRSASMRALAAPGTGLAASVALDDDVDERLDRANDADEMTLGVWNGMAAYLDQKMYEVKLSASSISHDYLEEMTYIMAAFADEAFLCLLDWNGKSYWRDHLMELRLFRSQIAGQEIFKRIVKVIARRDHGAEELCAVYLMVLSLGFKGQYLHYPAAVDTYRSKLFDRLQMTNPELRQESRHLIPEAYLHTVTEGAPVRLPEPRKWWLVVAAILAGWLILSTIAWLELTRPTRQLLAVTGRSLDRLTGTSMAASAEARWREVDFTLQSDAFRLELPSQLPLDKAASGQSSSFARPLLIAVDSPLGSGAGSAAQVERWLSEGSTVVRAGIAGMAPESSVVVSVERLRTPPEGVTSTSTTMFFAVDTSVNSEELGRHAQLIFPFHRGDGIAVKALTLYVPDDSTAGEP
jgi:type VI secretion system protein ImpK